MNWKIQEIPELKGFVVEWAEPGNYLLSYSNKLFHSVDLVPPFQQIAEIDTLFWKKIASRSRLAQRLLRFSATNALPLSNSDIFVAFDRSVGIVRDGRYRELKGLVRPCRILRSACAVGKNGDLFFGEYLLNNERGEIRIYKYVPGDEKVNVAYTFPQDSIRHIHGIYSDPFTDSLVCMTGDTDPECRILSTSDEFQTIETIGEGDESWRAVSALFTENAIYYGTDAEHRINTIYRLDRDTNERTSLGEVSGTVFYSQAFNGELFFATTAENAPSQTENVAAIWNIDHEEKLAEIAKFPKDRWHPTLFGFGTVHFPYISSTSERLFFHLSATEGDSRMFEILPNN